MSEALTRYIQTREAEFGTISTERRQQLAPVSDYIRKQSAAGKPVKLTFICTHNSRRSHLSQVWAKTAAARYGVANVESFSGGSEVSGFNPRAIAALRRAGFEISEQAEIGNPKYEVKWQSSAAPMICFSKKYDQAPNPTSGFAAVMVCSQADKACPLVAGADARFAVPFEDPKAFDDTPEEQRMYDERTAQIARELLFVFAQAAK
ncbi:protein-tyrosine-phosphatase [Planctomyces sp. SCGC AG-212-M04]|nr:protein-tyrosine-phosphatase [Planctomyces sp. SCGC AG-212-M04]